MTLDALDALHQQYIAAEPFPHAVIDGAVWDVPLEDAVAEFPVPDDPRWHTFDAPAEYRKQQMDGEAAWNVGPACIEVLDAMGRTEFVEAVEHVTGIEDLIPDITGGGLHQTLRNGFLGMHTDSTVDFAMHVNDDPALYRRVNVLLFLNDWQPSYGGALRLAAPQGDFVEVAPRFNRLVVFETTPRTFHGHPQPWACDEPRRSLACYYYTREPPAGYEYKETTFVG